MVCFGLTFAFCAHRSQNIAREMTPTRRIERAVAAAEQDPEGRRLAEGLERDIRSGRFLCEGATCPVCARRMAVVEVEGQQIDVCPGCLASWYDKGELAELLGLVRDVPGERFRSRDSRYRCPRCAKAMREFVFVNPFNLLVDRCQACGGVLLEGGEFDRAVELRGKG
jgi:Zn-finger nucleic acid-binding protein